MRPAAYYVTYLLFLSFLSKVNPEKRSNLLSEIEETKHKIKTKTNKAELQEFLANPERENNGKLPKHSVLVNDNDNDVEDDTMSKSRQRKYQNVDKEGLRNKKTKTQNENQTSTSGFNADNEESSSEELQTTQSVTTVTTKPKKEIGVDRNIVNKIRNPSKSTIVTSDSASMKSCRSTNAKIIRNRKECDSDDEADSEDSEEGESQEDLRPRRKIKYSIKFAHEKERSKKKKHAIDSTIMRIHKSGKKKNRYFDDNDSSEEDDEPFPKKFRFFDDDEDF